GARASRAGALNQSAQVGTGARLWSVSSWMSGARATAVGESSGPWLSISRGLHTGTYDTSTSFSITSAGSATGSIGMLRTATSTPSVVKLALLIEEEMRASISGWALAKR